MSNIVVQSVAVIANLATFNATNALAYIGAPGGVVFLQGQTTLNDGYQAFYQANLADRSTAQNFPTVIVDGAGTRWNQTTDITGSVSYPITVDKGGTGLVTLTSGAILIGAGTSNVTFLAPGTGVATWIATPSSANLAACVTDETGSGSLVFATSPTLVTPLLGTPTSGNLVNCTGYVVGNIGGLGTGVATWLATPSSANLAACVTDETGSGSLVFATSPTLVTPLLGTPTSGVLTNCTGYPAGSISGLGTGVATWLATPSSANLAACVTDETGSGALVFATSPTLVTPILGTPTSGTLTNCTGYTVGNISGLGAGIATFLATPSSANLAAAVTDETGSGALVFAASPTFSGTIGGTLTFSGALTLSSLVTLSAGGNNTPAATPSTTAIGYLGAPVNTQDATYGIVMTDAGKLIYHTSASTHTWTIPANGSVAFPIGTVILLNNENGGGNVTVAITTDTLRWGSSTGSRTLAANGTATIAKVAATTWRMTGDGIT